MHLQLEADGQGLVYDALDEALARVNDSDYGLTAGRIQGLTGTWIGGNKIGVMWSDQNTATDFFAVHSDAQPDNVWTIETALQGTGLADDHINLKTDVTGRVFAAVKTSPLS